MVTDPTQPADPFVIGKIKYTWTNCLEAYKTEIILNGDWMGENRGYRGKLRNPGNSLFLKLLGESVCEVKCQTDDNEVLYEGRAMMRTGRSLNINGKCEESQLSLEHQGIVANFRSNFDC